MVEHMERLIAMLREHVQSNLGKIRKNQEQIREILKEPVSDNRSVKFDAHYAKSKELLKENQDFINVQVVLVNFLDKYRKMLENNTEGMNPIPSKLTASQTNKTDFSPGKNTESKPSTKPAKDAEENWMDWDTVFENTIAGIMLWDESHPLFMNEEFYNQLMKHYLAAEDYESCGRLVQSKK